MALLTYTSKNYASLYKHQDEKGNLGITWMLGYVFLGGKKPSHGPGAATGAFPFRVAGTAFLGLLSPTAEAIVLTIAFRENASVGRDCTGSRHVGHV